MLMTDNPVRTPSGGGKRVGSSGVHNLVDSGEIVGPSIVSNLRSVVVEVMYE